MGGDSHHYAAVGGDRSTQEGWENNIYVVYPTEHDRMISLRRSLDDDKTPASASAPVPEFVPPEVKRPPLSLLGVLGIWKYELLALSTAIGLLIAQFILLAFFDGKAMSEWEASIGLNTLVAVLSTIARMCLAFITSEIIAQIQWSWIQRAVPLKDMEALNKASRGAWASLKLLFTSNALKRPDLLLALVVTIVSLSMGAFSQQGVQTVSCQVLDRGSRASLPNTRTLGNMGTKTQTSVMEETMLDLPARAGLVLSLFDPNQTIMSHKCSSGNCTFRIFEEPDGTKFTHRTAGFCSRCMDLSSHIVVDRGNGTQNDIIWRLRNGQEVSLWLQTKPNATENIIPISGTTFLDITNSPSYPIAPDPFWHYLPDNSTWTWRQLPEAKDFINTTRFNLFRTDFLSIDTFNTTKFSTTVDLSKLTVSAATCAIYPCLKTYHAAIENNNLTEHLVSSSPFPRSYGHRIPVSWLPGGRGLDFAAGENKNYLRVPDSDLIAVRTPCLVDNQLYTSENISTAPNPVTLTRWDFGSLTRDGDFYLEPVFEDNWRTNRSREVNVTGPPGCIYAMDLTGWYLEAQKLLRQSMNGACAIDNFGNRVSRAQCRRHDAAAGATEPFWLEGFARLERRGHVELERHLGEVAEGMTRLLRMGRGGGLGRGVDGNEWRGEMGSEAVVGEVLETTVCFAVNMGWLAMPAALTVLTLVVLVWTIVRGAMSGEVVWRSTILPLVHYRDRMRVVASGDGATRAPSPHEGVGLLSEKEMEEESKLVTVVFSGNARSGHSS